MNIVKCRIADFNIAFEFDFNSFEHSTKDYRADFGKEDFYVKLLNEDISYEEEAYGNDLTYIYANTFKRTALFRGLAEQLPSRNAFVLHSACFDVNGVGVAFAAHSGTGKSTHMMRWLSYLGDKATVVNGDKPIVRFIDGETYAYGTPWMGKEKLGSNMRTPLKHICFIERSETNYVEKLDKNDALKRIFKQVYMPKEPMAVVNTMQLIDRLLSSCQLWVIHCNMDENAGEIAYKTIFAE